MGTYWRVLGEHGITKDGWADMSNWEYGNPATSCMQEHLTSYSRPITTEPYMVQTDVGRLINDFERHLVQDKLMQSKSHGSSQPYRDDGYGFFEVVCLISFLYSWFISWYLCSKKENVSQMHQVLVYSPQRPRRFGSAASPGPCQGLPSWSCSRRDILISWNCRHLEIVFYVNNYPLWN